MKFFTCLPTSISIEIELVTQLRAPSALTKLHILNSLYQYHYGDYDIEKLGDLYFHSSLSLMHSDLGFFKPTFWGACIGHG